MKRFKFVDLFAGIGGFHLAMHSLGGECVFASEIDTFARKTYSHNFNKISPDLFKNELFNSDIRSVSPENIPDFDILCAGFPCQPFSQAGYKRGFDDTHKSERGNLFFNIVDIISAKKPKAFFLENVRGIVNHDNGKTFSIIRDILENELDYSFYYKIIQASDYGLPQLRPRVYMIGFRDDNKIHSFEFPEKTPLKFNMSHVWGGDCSREIGFTLRVGGRGSNINDRRNWDSYLVDGQVKKIMPEQGKIMQGFPDDFEFPVPLSQAMKQIGNSVAVDAIRECAKSLIKYMHNLEIKDQEMKITKNKGEWSELYTFFKIINDRKLILANKNLEISESSNFFNVTKVTTLNIDESCYLDDNDNITIINKKTGQKLEVLKQDILDENRLNHIVSLIKKGNQTFEVPEIYEIQNKLEISINNGGNSNQKADIVLDIDNNQLNKKDEGFGIKSYLGSKPTLLNASSNTNFIYEVHGLNISHIDEINSIDSRNKLKDRIDRIHKLNGKLVFVKAEKDSMTYNLNMVDSIIPELISKMLVEFYISRTSSFSNNLSALHVKNELKYLKNEDLCSIQVKLKRLLVAVLLGLFSGQKWDGKYTANGAIIIKENGDQVGLHIIEINELESYLFENIKFDTPSTTRHRFGSLIVENDGKIYFKLNLQLRF